MTLVWCVLMLFYTFLWSVQDDNLDVDKTGKSLINKLYIWEKGVSSAKYWSKAVKKTKPQLNKPTVLVKIKRRQVFCLHYSGSQSWMDKIHQEIEWIAFSVDRIIWTTSRPQYWKWKKWEFCEESGRPAGAFSRMCWWKGICTKQNRMFCPWHK